MIFTAPDNDGMLGYRRIRVVGEHIDGGWVIEDLPSRLMRIGLGSVQRCPDLNLRVVFRPEER
jgi:hypothetical protein